MLLNLMLKFIKSLVVEMKDFNYQISWQITFCKEMSKDETKYSPPYYFSSNTQTVINDLGINESLESFYQMILSKV